MLLKETKNIIQTMDKSIHTVPIFPIFISVIKLQFKKRSHFFSCMVLIFLNQQKM